MYDILLLWILRTHHFGRKRPSRGRGLQHADWSFYRQHRERPVPAPPRFLHVLLGLLTVADVVVRDRDEESAREKFQWRSSFSVSGPEVNPAAPFVLTVSWGTLALVSTTDLAYVDQGICVSQCARFLVSFVSLMKKAISQKMLLACACVSFGGELISTYFNSLFASSSSTASISLSEKSCHRNQDIKSLGETLETVHRLSRSKGWKTLRYCEMCELCFVSFCWNCWHKK